MKKIIGKMIEMVFDLRHSGKSTCIRARILKTVLSYMQIKAKSDSDGKGNTYTGLKKDQDNLEAKCHSS